MNGKYDLKERTFQLAKECRFLVRSLKKTIENIEDGKQPGRSSGSIGANYIEANEKLGHEDLKLRLKIARKEAKESKYWLRLLGECNLNNKGINGLVNESEELKKFCRLPSIN